MADVKGLLADPQFNTLSAADQKAALARVDPQFQGLSDSDYQTFRQRMQPPDLGNQQLAKQGLTAAPAGQAPKIPIEPVANLSSTAGVPSPKGAAADALAQGLKQPIGQRVASSAGAAAIPATVAAAVSNPVSLAAGIGGSMAAGYGARKLDLPPWAQTGARIAGGLIGGMAPGRIMGAAADLPEDVASSIPGSKLLQWISKRNQAQAVEAATTRAAAANRAANPGAAVEPPPATPPPDFQPQPSPLPSGRVPGNSPLYEPPTPPAVRPAPPWRSAVSEPSPAEPPPPVAAPPTALPSGRVPGSAQHGSEVAARSYFKPVGNAEVAEVPPGAPTNGTPQPPLFTPKPTPQLPKDIGVQATPQATPQTPQAGPPQAPATPPAAPPQTVPPGATVAPQGSTVFTPRSPEFSQAADVANLVDAQAGVKSHAVANYLQQNGIDPATVSDQAQQRLIYKQAGVKPPSRDWNASWKRVLRSLSMSDADRQAEMVRDQQTIQTLKASMGGQAPVTQAPAPTAAAPPAP